MKNTEFVSKIVDIAKNYETLYVMGCFGAPLTGSNAERYCNNHSYNKASNRTKMIKEAADRNPPVYGFDCVNLIKAVLWGWSGNATKTYGGAVYKSNGVPDISANSMITKCNDVSAAKWDNMEIGEVVWSVGHIGVYIGDGLCVESTPQWANGVQITAIGNIGTKAGYKTRTWTKHGKLPWVKYPVIVTQNYKTEKTDVPVLKAGTNGKPVEALQALLNLRADVELEVDGSFGPATDRAIREYQRFAGLTQDGSAGSKTWSALIGG